jgi:hypothetical protein
VADIPRRVAFPQEPLTVRSCGSVSVSLRVAHDMGSTHNSSRFQLTSVRRLPLRNYVCISIEKVISSYFAFIERHRAWSGLPKHGVMSLQLDSTESGMNLFPAPKAQLELKPGPKRSEGPGFNSAAFAN